jgi:hypothetical protein
MPTLLPVADSLLNRPYAAERLRRLSPPNTTMHGYYLAQTMAAVGARDDALTELDHARSRHEPEFMFVAVDPVFDGLRSDPKFQALVRTLAMKP